MTAIRVIRYRTKHERADDNAGLIEGVFADLAGSGPEGIRYTALRLEDGSSFLHIVALDGDDNPLDQSPAFADFQAGIGERLDEEPFPTGATVVGSYGGHARALTG
jgi:hypothetical protein